ncbi:hypothetical protein RCTIPTONUS_107 [Rhodobacter phage RcTiptonus]|nr:hypothetical protein RCTIPTONUS_107 [Rhodobacter phage RcTiptonus]
MGSSAQDDLRALRTRVDYNAEAKAKFLSTAKKLLQRLKKELGNEYGECDRIRTNKGGIAVSGEVTLHYDRLYVQVSQSCMGDRGTVMFRSCASRNDYSGGQNNFADSETLVDTATLAAVIRSRVKP